MSTKTGTGRIELVKRQSVCRALALLGVFLVPCAVALASGSRAFAQPITFTIGSGIGAPGTAVPITLGLTTNGASVVNGGLDVLFDGAILSVNPDTDCSIAARLTPQFDLLAALVAAGKLRLLIDVHGLPQTPPTLTDGDLATCNFMIADDPGLIGTDTQLAGTRLQAGDAEGNAFPSGSLATNPGSVDIELATPSPTPTTTGTETQTATPTATATGSATPSPSETATPSATPTDTAPPTNTPTNTAAPTNTPTQTIPPTSTPTQTTPPTLTPTPVPCVSDPDCPPGQICLDQFCSVETCSDTDPCPGGRQCVNGICEQLPAPPPTNTPTQTTPPTLTPTPAPATPTRTAAPATATNTPQSGGGSGDDGGCNLRSGAGADGSILWLLIPAALIAWRRKARS